MARRTGDIVLIQEGNINMQLHLALVTHHVHFYQHRRLYTFFLVWAILDALHFFAPLFQMLEMCLSTMYSFSFLLLRL